MAQDKLTVAGDLLHDDADSTAATAHVVKIGSKALFHITDAVAVATGDRVAAAIDIYGGQRVVLSGMYVSTVYALAARTATPAVSSQVTNIGCKGAEVHISVTAITSAPSVLFTLEAVIQPALTTFVTILEKTITAVGNYRMRVYPGLVAVAGDVAVDIMPKVWRFKTTHSNADSMTYSVAVTPIP